MFNAGGMDVSSTNQETHRKGSSTVGYLDEGLLGGKQSRAEMLWTDVMQCCPTDHSCCTQCHTSTVVLVSNRACFMLPLQVMQAQRDSQETLRMSKHAQRYHDWMDQLMLSSNPTPAAVNELLDQAMKFPANMQRVLHAWAAWAKTKDWLPWQQSLLQQVEDKMQDAPGEALKYGAMATKFNTVDMFMAVSC